MAKLTGPLFSLGASGQIAKTLVFTPWKGLNNVRKYVVPANPKSDAQVAQRAFLTAAVLKVHTAESSALYALSSADKSAYARAGSLHPTPRTWFNEAVKIMVDAAVDVQVYDVISEGTCVYLAATTGTMNGSLATEAALTGFVKYGTSKNSMLSSVAADFAAHVTTCTLTGLVVGTVYYWQWQATPVANKTVCKSGIYTYLHKAP